MSKKIMMIRSSTLTSVLSRQLSNTFTAINQKLLLETPQKRLYAKDVSKDCCKNVSQTEGRQVEGPKQETTVPYRPGCPAAGSTMPLNYDPYRIKVPEIAVPPLPPSSAKWQGVVLTDDYRDNQQQQDPSQGGQETNKEEKEESLFQGDEKQKEDSWQLFKSPEIGSKVKDMFRNSALSHLDYWKEKTEAWQGAGKQSVPAPTVGPPPRLCYHGHNKYKFAFHEPWRPLDRLSLMAEAEKQQEEREREEGGYKVMGSDFETPPLSHQRNESF